MLGRGSTSSSGILGSIKSGDAPNAAMHTQSGEDEEEDLRGKLVVPVQNNVQKP